MVIRRCTLSPRKTGDGDYPEMSDENLTVLSSAALRKVIHIDMDAFYAAIEQRDHPEYHGKPLVVGGDPYGRGVVVTCSYEASRFGMHSAMPAARALYLCPDAIFVRPRIDYYRGLSREIMGILRIYMPLIEPLSLDETYLDITELAQQMVSATPIAHSIRARIFEATVANKSCLRHNNNHNACSNAH